MSSFGGLSLKNKKRLKTLYVVYSFFKTRKEKKSYYKDHISKGLIIYNTKTYNKIHDNTDRYVLFIHLFLVRRI